MLTGLSACGEPQTKRKTSRKMHHLAVVPVSEMRFDSRYLVDLQYTPFIPAPGYLRVLERLNCHFTDKNTGTEGRTADTLSCITV